MNRLWVALVGVLAMCCGGCDGWCGVEDHSYSYDGWISPDAGGPYTVGPYGACEVGRVRKLSPRLITRGAGMACGASCKQVTFPPSSGGEVTYDLWGSQLVYRTKSLASIYLVDLATDKEWALVENPPGTREVTLTITSAALFQGKVAYSVNLRWNRSPGMGVYNSLLVYDTATQQETTVGCWAAHDQDPYLGQKDGPEIQWLDFSEAGLVHAWGKGKASSRVTYHLDLSTGKETQVSQQSLAFRLWEHQMVWYDGLSDVTFLDLKTGKGANLSNHEKRQWQPSIWKHRVVWTDHRDNESGYVSVACGDTDIYLYDLNSNKLEVVAAQHPAQQDDPDVNGDLVAWVDYRNHPDATPCGSSWVRQSDVFVKDLKTGKTQKLALTQGLKEHTRVWGNQVFWAAWTGKAETEQAVFAATVK